MNRPRSTWRILCILLTSVMLFPSSVLAEEEQDLYRCQISIPFEYASGTGGQAVTVCLKADNIAAPMPRGTSGRIGRIRITRPGVYEFPPITYKTPGLYSYTCYIASPRCKADRVRYQVTVGALSDGRCVLILRTPGAGSKPDMLRFGSHNKTVKGHAVLLQDRSPATGDAPALILWLAAVIFSLAVLFFLRYFYSNGIMTKKCHYLNNCE